MKEINGSTLEGGGQILRNALAFAALSRVPIKISQIRKGRRPPGLKAQHAAGVNLVGEISKGSTLVGAFKDSQTLEFIPGELHAGEYSANPGTAGATTLLLQVSLPTLLFSTSPEPEISVLRLKGGTNAIQAPQIDYTEHVFLPFIKKHFGIDVKIDISCRGYYPKGGGQIQVTVPTRNTPLPMFTLLERGAVTAVRGRAYVARLPERLAKDCRDAAHAFLVKKGVDPSIIDIEYLKESPSDAFGAGSGILLWAETEHGCILGGSAIGKKGIDAADLGRQAAEELASNLAHGGCVDEYLQDQWIIFGALAQGKSRLRCGPLTLHTRTAIWLAEQLTEARFKEIPDEDGSTVIIECDGIGYTAPQRVDKVESDETVTLVGEH